jgi:hypothetical protein
MIIDINAILVVQKNKKKSKSDVTMNNEISKISLAHKRCRNPSLGLATKARACKVAGQEGSMGFTSCFPKSAKECE